MPDTNPPTAPVAAVAVKLPPFWPADPELWFAQVEAQFATRGITQQRTKFNHVIASLSPETAVEIRDLLITPPEDDPYNVLKVELVKRLTASEQRRLQQLLTAEELGDRKPSQLLRSMRQLLGPNAQSMDDSILRQLFLQRLPSNVQMVVAGTGTQSLDETAALADRIMEVVVPTIAPISSNAGPSVSDELAGLRNELKQLKHQLAGLTLGSGGYQNRGRSRSRQDPRRQNRSRSYKPTDPSLCFYHNKYGGAARTCRAPCSKAGNDKAGH